MRTSRTWMVLFLGMELPSFGLPDSARTQFQGRAIVLLNSV